MEDKEKIINEEVKDVDSVDNILNDEEEIEIEKHKVSKKEIEEKFNSDKSLKKKIILIIGTIIFIALIIWAAYYFFFYRLNLKTNISTNKQIAFVEINGKKEQIMTQTYLSALDYNMSFDVDKFKAFTYKNQDIYKATKNENIIVAVEKAKLPSACSGKSNLKFAYNNCEILLGWDEQEYYVYNDKVTYRILVKLPPLIEDDNNYKERIEIMLGTFKIGE